MAMMVEETNAGSLRLPILSEIGPETRGTTRGDDHGDHGHGGHGGGRGLGVLSDVLHAYIQLVADDHVVTEDEHQTSDERQIEIARALGRRAKLHGDLPDVESIEIGRGRGQFAREQEHGADAAQAPADGVDHEAGLRSIDEGGADDGAHGLADDLARAVECGHGAAVFLRNAVGQDRHAWRDHAVQADLQQ